MRTSPVLQTNSQEPIGQPSLEPARAEPTLAEAKVDADQDHFEANPIRNSPFEKGGKGDLPSSNHEKIPLPPFSKGEEDKPTDIDWVNALKYDIANKKDAKLTSDAIMTCLTPVLSGTGSGPLEVQIQALLMRIMGQVQSTKRDDNFEQTRLEYIKKALRSKEALAELKKLEQSLAAERKSHAEEENRAIEGFSSISRTLDEAIKTGLREMRAS